MNNKKYVLFDLDGTLTNSILGITKSVQYALKKYNIIVDDLDKLKPFAGPPLHESFRTFFDFSQEDSFKAVESYREYFKDIGIFENEVYQGIVELLENLKKQDKTLIVATSKPTVFAEKILKHFKLDSYFTSICGSNLDGTRCSKSEVIDYALKSNNITDFAKAVMVGDKSHDVLGAKKIGVTVIGVLYGYGDYDELKSAGADYIVATVEELEKILNEYNS